MQRSPHKPDEKCRKEAKGVEDSTSVLKLHEIKSQSPSGQKALSMAIISPVLSRADSAHSSSLMDVDPFARSYSQDKDRSFHKPEPFKDEGR